MTAQQFTLQDLERILLEGAGDEGVDFDAGILDTVFDELGYDSLAMLETSSRIEREYGVSLDDSTIVDSNTPRALIDVVNERLGAVV